jgi:flavin-dependent dehydrogenase
MSLAQSYEVIVIGGGAAGTAAAIGAASAGAATLLVESAPFLGGAATLKSVLTYCGLFTNHQKQAVFGVADQVLRHLRGMGAVSEPIQFHGVAVLIEPESVKYTLDQLCKRAGVHVSLHTMLLSAARNGDHITSVTLIDHNGITRSARRHLSMPVEKETLPSLAEPPCVMGTTGRSRRGR